MKLSKCFWNRYIFAWPFWLSPAVAGPADYSCVQCQRAQVSRYPNFTVHLLVSVNSSWLKWTQRQLFMA